MVKENIEKIRENIKKAAEKSGRSPEDITLLAVTKTVDFGPMEEAKECGVLSFGENRVQELIRKKPHFEGIDWHLIGHLQTNKVKQVVGNASLIHSVDSLRLAKEIDKHSKELGIITDILAEVNMAGEESKFGLKPAETEEFIKEAAALGNICIKGLMTVAPFTENPEDNRIYFRRLRELLIDINSKNIDNVNMSVLSMGMTGDYEVAIEEGATIVRVGTGIFGERNYNK